MERDTYTGKIPGGIRWQGAAFGLGRRGVRACVSSLTAWRKPSS